MFPDVTNHAETELSSRGVSEDRECAPAPLANDGAAAACDGTSPGPATGRVSRNDKEFDLRNCFVCQQWHRPYAAALMEADPSKLAELIATAERVMAVRYIELYTAQDTSGEIGDLQNAAYALSQMKRTCEAGERRERSVD